jgi:hypothetical protein
MNPTTPTEVQVITEMDVYEASVRKVVSRGNLNASPLEEPSYSWSDVETEEAKKPKIQESALTESANEQLDKLMTEIEDIVHSDNNIKVDVELESDEDMPELGDSESDMPELVDSESDMPDLVSDSDDEMPGLVEESDDEMPELVEESESENEELMIAVFKRPSCPRCEAALKVLLDHEENREEEEEAEEEHTYESESEESDDSDSDYVPSDSESESPRAVRQQHRWNTQDEPVENKRTACVPPLIQYIAIVLFVIHVLKFLLNEPSQRIRCYS